MTYKPLGSVYPFLHSSPFYPAPTILCFAMLFNWLDTPKVPFTVGTYCIVSFGQRSSLLWTHTTHTLRPFY